MFILFVSLLVYSCFGTSVCLLFAVLVFPFLVAPSFQGRAFSVMSFLHCNALIMSGRLTNDKSSLILCLSFVLVFFVLRALLSFLFDVVIYFLLLFFSYLSALLGGSFCSFFFLASTGRRAVPTSSCAGSSLEL